MKFNRRSCVLAVGALVGGISVVMGALGSHWLKDTLSSDSLQSYMIASRYGLIHAVLLVAMGFTDFVDDIPLLIPGLFVVGICLFSGSIFVLSILGGPAWVGPLTPIGGVMLILAWLSLAGLAIVGETPRRA